MPFNNSMKLDFSNFDVFADAISGYDLEFRQIDRGAFSSTLQQISAGSVFVSRMSSTRKLEGKGSPPPGLITFGVPTTECLPFVWRNHYSSGNTLQIYKPTTDLEIITQPFFEAIDVSISEDRLNLLCQQWELPEFNQLMTRREMISCNPDIMLQLRHILKVVCNTLYNEPNALNKENHNEKSLQHTIEYEIPYLLMQALMTGEKIQQQPTASKKARALDAAIEYIHNTPGQDISLNSFCLEAGINPRTMQRAFLERYGVTPKKYSLIFNLNNVYKELSHRRYSETQITEVAEKYGYWHMSQFAKDYKQLFGSLPSETLKKKHYV